MTSTRSGSAELAEAVGQTARELAGKIRRMVITRASGALWQVFGHLLLDGSQETSEAELFQGIGFASKPAADGDVEAIVTFPSRGGKPIIIATRQEATRQIVTADLEADETQMHGAIAEGGTIVRIMTNGTVEIRTLGGTAEPLAKASELQALASDFYSHIHAASGSPTSKAIAEFTLPDPPGLPLVDPGQPGTDVLKAE